MCINETVFGLGCLFITESGLFQIHSLAPNKRPDDRALLISNTLRYWYRSITNSFMHMCNGNIRGVNLNDVRNLSLKFGHINVRGGLRDKTAEVDVIIEKQKCHVLGVSETNQLDDDFIQANDKNYNFIPGFNYTDKKTRIGVYVHKTIS